MRVFIFIDTEDIGEVIADEDNNFIFTVTHFWLRRSLGGKILLFPLLAPIMAVEFILWGILMIIVSLLISVCPIVNLYFWINVLHDGLDDFGNIFTFILLSLGLIFNIVMIIIGFSNPDSFNSILQWIENLFNSIWEAISSALDSAK